MPVGWVLSEPSQHLDRYSHGTGVYSNIGRYSGFAAFDNSAAMATLLDPQLLGGQPTSWRRDFLIEHLSTDDPIPTYCAVRNRHYMYSRLNTGEEELYDLMADPYELDNLTQVIPPAPPYDEVRLRMRSRLSTLWRPRPLGYNPPPAP